VRRDSARLWERLAWVGGGGLLVFLCFYNLRYYPALWFDEGVHLRVARHLALTGEYAFGPAVGPTVFYPVAIAFRAWKIDVLPARLVMVGYLLVTLGLFYRLGRHVYGPKVACLATLLVLGSPGVALLWLGRQVLGEVPAMAFFLGGLLAWFRAVDAAAVPETRSLGETGFLSRFWRGIPRRGWLWLVLAGFLFALSIITKNQFFILLPTLLLVGLIDRLYYRRLHPLQVIIPVLLGVLGVAAWYLALPHLAPPVVVQHTVKQWKTAPARSILVLSPSLMMRSARFVFGPRVFYGWALPALVYALLVSLRRDWQGLREATLLAFVSLWLGWYIVLSIGWERYAFPAVMLLGLFVARLFHQLVQGPRLSFSEVMQRIQRGQAGKELLRLSLGAILVAMLLVPLVQQGWAILAEADTSAWQMADYLNANVPSDTVIETWEPEMAFLTKHHYHSPPAAVLDAMSRHIALGTPLPPDLYDFLTAEPEYILVGKFAKWTRLYTDSLSQCCQFVVSFGEYALYRVKNAE